MLFAIVNSSPFKAEKQLACPVVHRIYGAHTSKENVSAFPATNFCAMCIEMRFKVAPGDINKIRESSAQPRPKNLWPTKSILKYTRENLGNQVLGERHRRHRILDGMLAFDENEWGCGLSRLRKPFIVGISWFLRQISTRKVSY